MSGKEGTMCYTFLEHGVGPAFRVVLKIGKQVLYKSLIWKGLVDKEPKRTNIGHQRCLSRQTGNHCLSRTPE